MEKILREVNNGVVKLLLLSFGRESFSLKRVVVVVVNEEEEEDEWEIEEDMGLGRNEREEDIVVPQRFFSSEGLSNM